MRIAEIPPAQSGLLAVAVKLTGEPYCQLMGEVTVTTGVVAYAGTLSAANPQKASPRREKEKGGVFTAQPFREQDTRTSHNSLAKPVFPQAIARTISSILYEKSVPPVGR